MRKLYNNLHYLKVGSSPADYPVFSQLIFFKGGNLYTCNGNEAVIVHDSGIDMEGSVNVYILESYLKMFDGELDEYRVDDDKLVITKGNFKTALNISKAELPELSFEDVEAVEISEDLLTMLKKSLPFTGSGILEYIYLCPDFVCATNGSKLMLTDNIDYSGVPIILSKKILSILSVGDKIGVKDNNVVVYFNSGIAVFTIDRISEYPAEKIKTFVDTSFDSTEELCSTNGLSTAFTKVEPVLFKETRRLVTIENKSDSMLLVSATSINGSASSPVERTSNREFNIMFDLDLMKGISENYDVLISSNVDKLLLTDNFSRIILMGV